MYELEVPLAYKSVGIPYSELRVEASPLPLGLSHCEWGVSLPDSAIARVKEKFKDTNIVIGYGNILSIYSLRDGLTKDMKLVTIEQPIRDRITTIYLWKKR